MLFKWLVHIFLGTIYCWLTVLWFANKNLAFAPKTGESKHGCAWHVILIPFLSWLCHKVCENILKYTPSNWFIRKIHLFIKVLPFYRDALWWFWCPRKMLTGEELCTSGDATLGGFDIKTQQNQVRRLDVRHWPCFFGVLKKTGGTSCRLWLKFVFFPTNYWGILIQIIFCFFFFLSNFVVIHFWSWRL